jgi:hypothetical protein
MKKLFQSCGIEQLQNTDGFLVSIVTMPNHLERIFSFHNQRFTIMIDSLQSEQMRYNELMFTFSQREKVTFRVVEISSCQPDDVFSLLFSFNQNRAPLPFMYKMVYDCTKYREWWPQVCRSIIFVPPSHLHRSLSPSVHLAIR